MRRIVWFFASPSSPDRVGLCSCARARDDNNRPARTRWTVARMKALPRGDQSPPRAAATVSGAKRLPHRMRKT